jgi:uncharacterized protein (DUF2267 family)
MTYDTLDRRYTLDGNTNNREPRRTGMNFDKFAAEGNQFINDVADELGVTRNAAARITRAVLHAVRDRLPANDAVQFAQGLPMALKGVYFDEYDLSDSPVIIRNAEDFIDFVAEKNMRADVDFPDDNSVRDALQGVFCVLEEYMDQGQVDQVKLLLGKPIRELLE